MSSTKESSISSITPLTSENYHSWADNIKSWLQLNGLWHLVSGLERKPARKAEVRDTAGNVVTPAVDVDEDKLEGCWCPQDCHVLRCQGSHQLSRRQPYFHLEHSSAPHYASTPTMPSYLSKNRSLSRWRGSSTGWMNISRSSGRFHPPPSLWTTSMMSWLLWPSSERFPTPLTKLYAPSQS